MVRALGVDQLPNASDLIVFYVSSPQHCTVAVRYQAGCMGLESRAIILRLSLPALTLLALVECCVGRQLLRRSRIQQPHVPCH